MGNMCEFKFVIGFIVENKSKVDIGVRGSGAFGVRTKKDDLFNAGEMVMEVTHTF